MVNLKAMVELEAALINYDPEAAFQDQVRRETQGVIVETVVSLTVEKPEILDGDQHE